MITLVSHWTSCIKIQIKFFFWGGSENNKEIAQCQLINNSLSFARKICHGRLLLKPYKSQEQAYPQFLHYNKQLYHLALLYLESAWFQKHSHYSKNQLCLPNCSSFECKLWSSNPPTPAWWWWWGPFWPYDCHIHFSSIIEFLVSSSSPVSLWWIIIWYQVHFYFPCVCCIRATKKGIYIDKFTQCGQQKAVWMDLFLSLF